MPESPRYYISKGRMEEGEKVIRRIAWFNRKKPPSVSMMCAGHGMDPTCTLSYYY